MVLKKVICFLVGISLVLLTSTILVEAGDVSMLYGSGKYTYRLLDEWANLPQGWTFTDGAGIAIDSSDKVYILSRGTHPVTIWNRDGNLLGNWGGELFQTGPRGDFWP